MSSPPQPAPETSATVAPAGPSEGKAEAKTAAAGVGRLTLALLFAVCAMFLFILIAHQVFAGATRRLDTTAVGFFQTHQIPVIHQLMVAVSWVAGAGGSSIVVAAALYHLYRQRRLKGDAVALLLVFPGGLLIVQALKFIFHRPRPTLVYAGHVRFTGYSFPSGHSFSVIVVFGLIAYWLSAHSSPWRRTGIWVIAVLFILLVGFSRVFLGAHYPSDVIAGFVVGYPWLWGCLAVSNILKQRVRTDVATDALSKR